MLTGTEQKTYLLVADGSVSKENGTPQADGGFGWLIPDECFYFGYVKPPCTNNISEMLAVMSGVSYLKYHKKAVRVKFVSDSQYVCKGWTLWNGGWYRKGYKDVKNAALWEKIYHLDKTMNIVAEHVRGHGKDRDNKSDELVAYNAFVDHLATLGRLSEKSHLVNIDDEWKLVLEKHKQLFLVGSEMKAKSMLYKFIGEKLELKQKRVG